MVDGSVRPKRSTTNNEPSTSGSAPLSRARYLAAVGTALLGMVLAAVVIRHTELVTGRYIGAGVPPILSFAATLLLVALRPALRRLHPALEPDRRQVLIVYAMMTIALV